jgi:hypothetical protein
VISKKSLYRGTFLIMKQDGRTKKRKKIEAGQILLATGEPDAGDDWCPVLYRGKKDHVRLSMVASCGGAKA